MLLSMAIRNKNLNLIPILQSLLNEASVVRAADAMGLSQPAMSGALARLRELLNDPLLVRSGRGMQLTPRARELKAQVDTLCARIDVVFQPDTFDPSTARDSFRVAAPDYLAFQLTKFLLPLLAECAPGIHIQIVDVPGDLPIWMESQNIDLAVCGEFGFWPELRRELLFRERYVAALSTDHPLSTRETVSSDELQAFPSPSVVFDPGLSKSHHDRHWVTGLRSLDFISQVTSMSQFIAVLLAAEAPNVARAPASMVEQLSGILPLKLLEISDEDASFDTCTFWTTLTDQSISHIWLRGIIRDCLSDQVRLSLTA
jgi:DNA-binding transcriptional LysR family regulator